MYNAHMAATLPPPLPGHSLCVSLHVCRPQADKLEDFTNDHVCAYLLQCKLPSKVIDAMRENAVTGPVILLGLANARSGATTSYWLGVTDADLAELGIASRLLRNAVLVALTDLVKSKGLRACSLYLSS